MGCTRADDLMASAAHPRARRIIRAVVIFDLLLLPANLVSLLLTSQYQATYGSSATNLLLVFGTLVQVAVAAIVGLRRPGNPVGWLLLLSVTANLVDSGVFQPFVIYSIHITNRAVPGGDFELRPVHGPKVLDLQRERLGVAVPDPVNRLLPL